MTSRQQQRSEASYEALMRSAITQFFDRGYAATSVDDIVRDTGYSRGAFYFHFTNKLHCFLELIPYREQKRRDWAQLPSQRDVRQTSREAILREAVAMLATSLDGNDSIVLLMVECYQQTRRDEEARGRLREAYRAWLAEITTFVRGLQDGGWVDPERDPQRLATRIFAFMEGLYVHRELYALEPDLLADTMFGGLLALLPPPAGANPD